MITVISQPPYDDFTYSLFEKWIASLTCEHKAYYIWSNPSHVFQPFILETDFGQYKNVIIGIKDLLDLRANSYNYWQDSKQAGVRLLDTMAKKYPSTNFVICTSLENLHLENLESSNIQVVPWGGDLVNQSNLYKTINPVLDKNFNSTKTFVTLNRNARDHRVALLCYLFGKKYDEYGKLSFLDNGNPDTLFTPKIFEQRVKWNFDIVPHHTTAKEIMSVGYKQLLNNKDLVIDDFNIYETSWNDNRSNFDKRLRPHYQDSFIEIVAESTFSSTGYLLTEKTLNCFYGCNFPILLSGAGAVAHLRDIGFDMYDDIIDHSYDKIKNPIDRLITAIESNKQLLTDAGYVKTLWKKSKSRFVKNIEVARNIYSWYDKRGTHHFNNLVWQQG